MHYQLRFRDKALFELREAYVWYEEKLAGLGREFRKEIDAKIEKLTNNP